MASRKPLPIQVGTIIYNEKDRLPKWLDHWKKVAERIVVLDQGSDDGTQKILDESGVIWFERLPRGNPDIHWNDLIGLAHADKWFFRHGVDEFIDYDGVKNIIKVGEAHPGVMAWWVKRINWINGIDLSRHPEVPPLLGDDWQLVVSKGRAYRFNGRMHNWPDVLVPGHMIGYIGQDVAHIDHRRTLEEVIGTNDDREHLCRPTAVDDQRWFKEKCRELVERYVPASE